MRKLSLRILVGLVTLGISVGSSWLLRHVRELRPTPAEAAPCLTAAPPSTPAVFVVNDDHAEYPDDKPLSPWEIYFFIDSHPRAKLGGLWTRLHVKADETRVSDFSECGGCSVKLDWYDLDAEPGDEALLKISDGEFYRYLVFKAVGDGDDFKFIGHVDEWGKYEEPQSYVVISGGLTWLVSRGQSASGSGVAYYHNQVFEVNNNRLKEVASYECEGSQSGWDGWPTKWFTTRILDVQKSRTQTRVKVEFNIEYSWSTLSDKELTLFSKRQVAVFVSTHHSASVLDLGESTVTQRELEHIYTVDSMTEHDFLKYNLSELLNLARRGNKAQKNWLKEFLERCDGSAEKRQLQAALAK
jgi:hypothetical protein